MEVLHLTLKKKWFDMIASGYKLEEYREIKPYWVSRLIDTTEYQLQLEQKEDASIVKKNICFDIINGHYWEDVVSAYHSKVKEFDFVKFTNGYGKNAPSVTVKCIGIELGLGMLSWGAEKDVEYFIIQLGDIVAHC